MNQFYKSGLFSLLCILCLNNHIWAQPYFLKWQLPLGKWESKWNSIAPHTDSTLCKLVAVKELNLLRESGYWLATSQAQWHYDTLLVRVDPKQPVYWASLSPGNVPEEWLTNSDLQRSTWLKQPIHTDILSKKLKELLNLASNNGYPFASFSLDSLQWIGEHVSATINLNKGPLIYFDSLDYAGKVDLKPQFIRNYCNIKAGTPYNESLLTGLDARVGELPYLKTVRPMGIYFYGNKAKPILYLEPRRANVFDGIIGFAPNSQLNNKLVLTGDINLKLQNIAGSGKNLEASFRSFLNGSQDLNLRCVWPYFAGTKLGIDYAFRLLKFDSIYLDINHDVGLQYRLVGNDYVKLFYRLQRVYLLTVDTNKILNTKQLPAYHDVRSDFFGIAVRRSKLDKFTNPGKGFLLEMEAGAGSKKIIPNGTINALVLNDSKGEPYHIYDSLKLSFLQYHLKGQLSKYWPLFGNFVGLTQFSGAYLNTQNLFVNDLYRIGGLKTLRGFDEQSIFADQYLISNLELRYRSAGNSNFIIFWNGAMVENKLAATNQSRRLWGAGAGMNIETPAGVFSFFYAVGTQNYQQIELKSAKIHFGFVNYF